MYVPKSHSSPNKRSYWFTCKGIQMISLGPDNYQIHGLSKESLPCRELLEHLYHQQHQGPASPQREWTEPSPAKAFLSRDFALDMKHLVDLAVVDVHVGHVKQTLACTTWGGRVWSAAARQVLFVQFDFGSGSRKRIGIGIRLVRIYLEGDGARSRGELTKFLLLLLLWIVDSDVLARVDVTCFYHVDDDLVLFVFFCEEKKVTNIQICNYIDFRKLGLPVK